MLNTDCANLSGNGSCNKTGIPRYTSYISTRKPGVRNLIRTIFWVSTVTSESAVQNQIRLAASNAGNFLWRNNSGAVTTADGRHIRFGLGNDSAKINAVLKSSDLIGITPVVIMPHHIGCVVGVFTAIECKSSAWRGPRSEHDRAQQNFINTVRQAGGFADFCTNVEEYKSCAKKP